MTPEQIAAELGKCQKVLREIKRLSRCAYTSQEFGQKIGELMGEVLEALGDPISKPMTQSESSASAEFCRQVKEMFNEPKEPAHDER